MIIRILLANCTYITNKKRIQSIFYALEWMLLNLRYYRKTINSGRVLHNYVIALSHVIDRHKLPTIPSLEPRANAMPWFTLTRFKLIEFAQANDIQAIYVSEWISVRFVQHVNNFGGCNLTRTVWSKYKIIQPR